MSKKKDKAKKELTIWLKNICYENGVMINDCSPTICKECAKGAWLIEDIKHKRGCEVSKAERNLAIISI